MYLTYAFLEIFTIVVILVLFFTGLGRKGKVNRNLVSVVASFILLLATDTTMWLLFGKIEYLTYIKICWIIFYILIVSCLNSFHEYIISFLGNISLKKRAIYSSVEIVGLVGIILWIISMFNGFIYYFEGAEYKYTKIYPIILILFSIPIIFDIVIILLNRKKFAVKKTVALLSYGILPLMTVPFVKLVGSSILTVLATAIAIILIYVVTSMETQEELIRKETEIAEKNIDLADKQFKLIYSQIQPHFLYNVLNTIYYLVDDDVEKGKKAIVDFSDYMRMNLDSLNKPMLIDFDDELRKTEIYLSLEKLRFVDELNLVFDIEERNFKIPQLTVQPLIENAVKHGICKKKGGGTITIYSKKEKEYFEIGVIDDGVGFDKNKPFSEDRTHIGLSNIVYRVENMCNGTVLIESEINKGTKITIRLPREDK